MGRKFNYKASGDSAILMSLDEDINEKTNKRIVSLANRIERDADGYFEEVIIGFRTLLVQYNPLKVSYHSAVEKLTYLESVSGNSTEQERRHIEIPVLYGGEYGPDLDSVAQLNSLSPEEVIKIHSEASYLVYFLGFTPGYPFMGGMSKEIATPRLDSPRISIAPGSVGIANDQTGIYPVESPGGWRIIGQTPLQLYNFKKEQPFLLGAGDYVTFRVILNDEFNDIKKRVEEGSYVSTVKERN
ncbi:5-oxoprolinase subunit PxpB [Virgibacillus sp. C22-A2]|uniref:5-oxoprolinase subunit PxpB n=1 Tax=Virgibacillus tibetensis TaxID=3042313 RepID=A0ABU6KEK3_9BACI|nr:5-oxoprolinase subunit PxpB [Virgibacillus sp. C22-A2]